MTDWISVEDRLPDKDGKYLVCGKVALSDIHGEPIQLVRFTERKEWLTSLSVKYWMPLPKPPELSEHETTTFKPIATDARGYARQFSCSACDCVVIRTHYMRPDQFDYEYCPYCGRPVESEDAE